MLPTPSFHPRPAICVLEGGVWPATELSLVKFSSKIRVDTGNARTSGAANNTNKTQMQPSNSATRCRDGGATDIADLQCRSSFALENFKTCSNDRGSMAARRVPQPSGDRSTQIV